MENTSKVNVFEKTAVFLFACFFEEGSMYVYIKNRYLLKKFWHQNDLVICHLIRSS